MLSDLFRLLAADKVSGAQLDAIGFEYNDNNKSTLENNSSEPASVAGVLPALQASATGSASQEDHWRFPILFVYERFPTDSVQSQSRHSEIPEWRPSKSPVLLKSANPAPLLALEHLMTMIEQNLTSAEQSRSVDIKALVQRQAAMRSIDPLPRQSRQQAGVSYAVVCDQIPELKRDVVNLKTLFKKLPRHLAPRQVWSLDQFGEWGIAGSAERRLQLSSLPVEQVLLVLDSRSPSIQIRQAMRMFAGSHQKVHYLTVTPKAGLYFGAVQPLSNDRRAVRQLMQLLYAVHYFPGRLLRELRLMLHGSTAAEVDFWRHSDVWVHNSALYDTGGILLSRESHYAALKGWLVEDVDRARVLIGHVLDHISDNPDQFHEAVLNLPADATTDQQVVVANLHFAGIAEALKRKSLELDIKYKLSAVILGVSERLVGEPTEMLANAIEAAQRFRVRVEGNTGILTGKPQGWMQGELKDANLVQSLDSIQLVDAKPNQIGKVAGLQTKGGSVVIDDHSGRHWLSLETSINSRDFVIYSANERIICKVVESGEFHWAESLEQSANGLTLTTSQLLKIHYPSEPANGPHPQIDSSEAPAWLSDEAIRIDQYGLSASLNIFGVEQTMRWIPPGRFTMGSPEDEDGRIESETPHDVILSEGYWLADTPCLQSLWQAVMSDSPSMFTGDNLPVDSVSWDMAQQFIDKVNDEYPGLNICLPSEAQWEYACRAGTQTPYSFGHQIDESQANYNGKSGHTTTEVGRFPSNQWGLLDMHGNVCEWCNDWYGPYSERDVVNPVGAGKDDYRVLRGGSWIFSAGNCRSACRDGRGPSRRRDFVGFRFAQVDQPKAAKRQPANTGEEAEQARRSRKSQRRIRRDVGYTEKK